MQDSNTKKRIKSKENKIKKQFKNIDASKKDLITELIYNAAFMSVKLEDLIEHINENGIKESYKNGENQFGYKESVEMKTYNTIVKNYTNIIKQLTDLVPAEEKKGVGEDLLKFIASGKK